MSKHVLAAVAAIGGLAVSAPAIAQIEFAVFNPVPSASGGVINFKDNGKGSLQSVKASTPTIFTFDLTPLANFGNLNATFDFNATQTGPATVTPAGVGAPSIISALFDGSFDFYYSGPNTTNSGITLTKGELLLSGTFQDAAFLGVASSSGAGLTDDSITGTVTFTSGISSSDLPIASIGQSFTLGFIDLSPVLSVQKTGAHAGDLRSFLTIGDGKFSADLLGGGGGGVPEPASWALMLLGFGSVGLAARRRSRTALV